MNKKSSSQVIIPFIAVFISAYLSLTFIPDTLDSKMIVVVAIVTFVAIVTQSIMKTVTKKKEQ